MLPLKGLLESSRRSPDEAWNMRKGLPAKPAVYFPLSPVPSTRAPRRLAASFRPPGIVPGFPGKAKFRLGNRSYVKHRWLQDLKGTPSLGKGPRSPQPTALVTAPNSFTRHGHMPRSPRSPEFQQVFFITLGFCI